MSGTAEESVFEAVLDGNIDSAREKLKRFLPSELRAFVYACFEAAELAQDVERGIVRTGETAT